MRKKKSGLSNVEKEKISKNARRIAARKYGFKQCDYSNWIAKDGFFFTVLDLHEVSLSVKPLYVDDLLHEIVYEKELRPMSLRAVGAFVCDDKTIAVCPTPLDFNMDDSVFDEDNAIRLWEEVFDWIDSEVKRFMTEHPDVEDYNVERSDRGDQVTLLMILCHHGRYNDAIRIIDEEWAAKRNGCMSFVMPDGTDKNVYDFIREYCERML